MSQWRPQVLTASRLQALWILSLRRLGSDGFKVIEPTNMEWRKINKKMTEKGRFWFRNFNSMFFNMFLFDMCWYLLIFIALILIDICWHVLIVVDIYWYLLIFIDSLLYSLIFIAIYHDIDFHFKNPIISVSRNRSIHQAAQAQTCLGGEIEVQKVTKPSKLAIQQKQIGICLGYKCWDVLLALFDIYIHIHYIINMGRDIMWIYTQECYLCGKHAD